MDKNKEKSNQIPEGGTLGILAYGYKSIMLWRQERNRIMEDRLKAVKAQKKKDEKE